MSFNLPLNNPPKDFIFKGKTPYHYLQTGETVLDGDEYRVKGGKWEKTFLVNSPASKFLRYRRPLTKPPKLLTASKIIPAKKIPLNAEDVESIIGLS